MDEEPRLVMSEPLRGRGGSRGASVELVPGRAKYRCGRGEPAPAAAPGERRHRGVRRGAGDGHRGAGAGAVDREPESDPPAAPDLTPPRRMAMTEPVTLPEVRTASS